MLECILLFTGSEGERVQSPAKLKAWGRWFKGQPEGVRHNLNIYVIAQNLGYSAKPGALSLGLPCALCPS